MKALAKLVLFLESNSARVNTIGKHELCADTRVCARVCERTHTSWTQHISLTDRLQLVSPILPTLHPSISIVVLLRSVFIAVHAGHVCACSGVCFATIDEAEGRLCLDAPAAAVAAAACGNKGRVIYSPVLRA